MRVAVTIQHPAHVHFFRPLVAACREAGDEVLIVLREKDVAGALLDGYGLTAITVDPGSGRPLRGPTVADRLRSGLPDTLGARIATMADAVASLAGMATQQLRWELGLTARLRAFDPDVITAIGGLGAAHAGSVLGVPSVVFTDSEVATNRAMAPFADVVATPRAYDGRSFGHRHRRYDGFHELAYLHPARFTPDPAVLRERGVDPEEPFVVARFGAMDALHDRGERGLSPAGKRRLIGLADEFGTVYVTSERRAGNVTRRPASADRRRGALDAPADGQSPAVEPLPVAPHELHHLLAHADLVVADAATTAVEAGLLGTPSVRVTSLAAPDAEMGTLRALDTRGIVRSTAVESVAVNWVRDILADPEAAADHWALRREALLSETVDVADYATRLVRTVGRSQSLPVPPDRRVRADHRAGVGGGHRTGAAGGERSGPVGARPRSAAAPAAGTGGTGSETPDGHGE